jgi:ABC-2 type transport system ATP-binding protein
LSAAVRAEGLVKVYPGGIRALKGLSFEVMEGEIYGLIGPNGAGKTTTLRIVATLLRPTAGDVKVFGISVTKDPLKVRKLISYLPEEAGAYKRLTGREFLELVSKIRFRDPKDREEYIDEAIKIAELGEAIDRKTEGYSKGMKRRLLLAATLAIKPRLVILDEPTSGLDVLQSLRIREIIRDYNKKYNITVLLSSHNMLEVEFLSDRVGIIYEGKLLAEGSPRELKERTGSSNLEEVFKSLIRGKSVELGSTYI